MKEISIQILDEQPKTPYVFHLELALARVVEDLITARNWLAQPKYEQRPGLAQAHIGRALRTIALTLKEVA